MRRLLANPRFEVVRRTNTEFSKKKKMAQMRRDRVL